MIQIDLKLFVTLSKYHPCGSGAVEVAEGTSVEKLIRDLGIPGETVKLIFINGKKAAAAQVLNEGDRLGLFPPVGGG
ncbi:MAG: MoaD/ThiS family protein [Desulfobacterales bacterium]|nr:MoaD/ThiS family protein [Desulfobacterales bacterium]